MLLRPSTRKRIFLSSATSNTNTKLTNSPVVIHASSLKSNHHFSTSSIGGAPFTASSITTTSTSIHKSCLALCPNFRKPTQLTTTKLLADELTCSTGTSDASQARLAGRSYPLFGSYWHVKARLIEPLEPSASASTAGVSSESPSAQFIPTHTPTSSIDSVCSSSTVTHTHHSSPASSVASTSDGHDETYNHHHNYYPQQPGPDIQYVLTELARREQTILDLRLEVAALEADLEAFKSRVFPVEAVPPSPVPSEESVASVSTTSSAASIVSSTSEVVAGPADAGVTSKVYKSLANNISILNVGIGLWALGFGLGKQIVFGY